MNETVFFMSQSTKDVHFAAGILFFKIKFISLLKKKKKKENPRTPGALDKTTHFLLGACPHTTTTTTTRGRGQEDPELAAGGKAPSPLCSPSLLLQEPCQHHVTGTNRNHFIMRLSVFAFITRDTRHLNHHSSPLL